MIIFIQFTLSRPCLFLMRGCSRDQQPNGIWSPELSDKHVPSSAPIKIVNLYLDISSKGVDSRSPKKWETREFQGQYVKVGRRISSQREMWDQKAGHWGGTEVGWGE